MKKKYIIKGMGCAACAATIEKSVNAMPSVREARVNLVSDSMIIDFDEKQTGSSEIIKTVRESGYDAEETKSTYECKKNEEKTAVREIKELKYRFLISLIFLIPLMVLSMGAMINLPVPEVSYWILGVLAVPVAAINYKYYTRGFKLLFKASPNMDSLIAIGSLAALILGYFESAVMILTLVTLGKWLEARSKGRTGDAVKKLMALAPEEARIITKDGQEKIIPAEDLLPGDIIAVKSGESIPADGTVTEGTCTLDESTLTGESMPVDKGPGDEVFTATINKAGYLRMKADKVGEETAFSGIIRLVEEAANSKAPIARQADKVSAFFVPAVILIAVITAVCWILVGAEADQVGSMSIAVLVISCPCALGLATPLAIMTGTGRGAEKGILFRTAEALETVSKTRVAVIDKTGTLTKGKPEISEIVTIKGTEEDVIAYTASLEKLSEHPLGLPIIERAEKKGLDIKKVNKFLVMPGRGIEGIIDGKRVLSGNKEFMHENDIFTEEGRTAKLYETGRTLIYTGIDGDLAGIIALRDEPKESSREAVLELKEMGIETVMLTGDNQMTAEVIAKETGIDKVVAQVMPEEKKNVIDDIKKEGKSVLMIGDGINDAPALKTADTGIAIGAGTDIAIEAADIVLMHEDPKDGASAVKLSKAVVRNIKQNLFWAFFYNSLGIPLAAGVFYPFTGWTLDPVFAAAAMSMSSLCVVTNALRLRKA
ncbi:MAG TPA: heavy metal translocating P-type ATPase [Bacillota bacterium]|nr:heavy metal translocating P-type ATPase [Bacillota bacterium]